MLSLLVILVIMIAVINIANISQMVNDADNLLAILTDNNGYFLINKVPDGTYTLCARFSTYEDFREELTLSHQTVVKNIKLRPKSRRMKEVVITSSKVNAETAQTIDLSNVAKGAYFVRITNNNISKVEKLIVR